ncbi:MAG: hypothetical protein JXB47_13635 [Anaerolineae bacterium]|nr:hypothetical protein [Anaerolineae bacterium]
MAELTEEQCKAVWAAWMRVVSAAGETVDLTKSELYDATVAVDVWINANAAAFNNALPAPAKAALTAGQKAHLFAAVAVARYGGQ